MDDRTRLLRESPSDSLNAIQSDIFPSIQAGAYKTNPSLGVSTNTIEDNVVLQCQTSFQTVFASGATADIRITPGFVQGYINRATIQMAITNNDAAAIQLCNAFQLLNMVQLLVNGGNDLAYQITGDQLYLNTMLYDPAKWKNRAVLANTDSAWGTGVAIAAGATATYYIDLVGSLLEQIKLFAHATKQDLILRLYFNTQAQVQQAGAATAMTLATLNLVFNVIKLDNSTFNRKLREYQESPHVFRFLNNVVAPFPNQSFTAGSTVSLKLQQIKGPVAFIRIYARAPNAVGDARNAFTDLDGWQFNLLDSTGVAVLASGLTGKFIRYHETPEKFDSEMPNNKAVYTLSFSSDPLLSYKTGAQLGYRYFDGDYALQVIPSATVARDFFVDGVMYENLFIDNKTGNIATTR